MILLNWQRWKNGFKSLVSYNVNEFNMESKRYQGKINTDSRV